jgi:hypothetical protein
MYEVSKIRALWSIIEVINGDLLLVILWGAAILFVSA